MDDYREANWSQSCRSVSACHCTACQVSAKSRDIISFYSTVLLKVCKKTKDTNNPKCGLPRFQLLPQPCTCLRMLCVSTNNASRSLVGPHVTSVLMASIPGDLKTTTSRPGSRLHLFHFFMDSQPPNTAASVGFREARKTFVRQVTKIDALPKWMEPTGNPSTQNIPERNPGLIPDNNPGYPPITQDPPIISHYGGYIGLILNLFMTWGPLGG